MPIPFIILMIIMIVFIIATPIVFFLVFWLPNYKSVMKRARKIDPSVKTFADATYVLQKNVFKSDSQNNSNAQNENTQNNNESEQKN